MQDVLSTDQVKKTAEDYRKQARLLLETRITILVDRLTAVAQAGGTSGEIIVISNEISDVQQLAATYTDVARQMDQASLSLVATIVDVKDPFKVLTCTTAKGMQAIQHLDNTRDILDIAGRILTLGVSIAQAVGTGGMSPANIKSLVVSVDQLFQDRIKRTLTPEEIDSIPGLLKSCL
jgi:hypothetical protein